MIWRNGLSFPCEQLCALVFVNDASKSDPATSRGLPRSLFRSLAGKLRGLFLDGRGVLAHFVPVHRQVDVDFVFVRAGTRVRQGKPAPIEANTDYQDRKHDEHGTQFPHDLTPSRLDWMNCNSVPSRRCG